MVSLSPLLTTSVHWFEFVSEVWDGNAHLACCAGWWVGGWDTSVHWGLRSRSPRRRLKQRQNKGEGGGRRMMQCVLGALVLPSTSWLIGGDLFTVSEPPFFFFVKWNILLKASFQRGQCRICQAAPWLILSHLSNDVCFYFFKAEKGRESFKKRIATTFKCCRELDWQGESIACGLETQRVTLKAAEKKCPSHASAINFALRKANILGIRFLPNQSQWFLWIMSANRDEMKCQSFIITWK